MICYKDKTFCKFYKDCTDGNDCHRALTDEVQKAAGEWWATYKSITPTPISQFTELPDCFVEFDH